MSLDTERLLEIAAKRIKEAEDKHNAAVTVANRLAAANESGLKVIAAHQASIATLKDRGCTMVLIEFVEGVVETIARDMNAALTGKRPNERFDA